MLSPCNYFIHQKKIGVLSKQSLFLYIFAASKQKQIKMKKTLILLFVASLGAGSMTSCKKTSTGKLTGDWTVASYVQESSTTESGITSSSTQSNDGTTTTTTNTNASGSVSTTSTESETMVIDKDGTYTEVNTVVSTEDYTDIFSGDVYGATVTTTITTTNGTWSLVKKNKAAEYKSHERVIFSGTGYDRATTAVFTPNAAGTADGEVAGTSTDNWSSTGLTTYTGDSYVVVVDESTKKELTISLADEYTVSSSDSDGTTTTTDPVQTRIFSFTKTLTQE